jgi:response regulator RpfG family c-di-GMP phosphodiesterase
MEPGGAQITAMHSAMDPASSTSTLILREGLVGLAGESRRGLDSRPRVLCVDDEEDVLDALRRVLGPRFLVDTAPGARDALEMIDGESTYAAVLSDRRMPGMDGVAFLAECRVRSHATARLLLTAQLDLEVAVAAVNEAQIFRLLKKPCRREGLIAALEEAVAYHRASIREHALREQAVRGSMDMLRGVLTLVRPDLGQRAARIAGYVSELVGALGIGDGWAYETAATLSPLATLDAAGHTLPPPSPERRAEEHLASARCSRVCEELLGAIPGLEQVREMLHYRERRFDGSGGSSGASSDELRGEEIPFGARVLRVVTDFEALESSGIPTSEAIAKLRNQPRCYDPHVVSLLERSLTGEIQSSTAPHELPLESLEPGMVLAEDLCTERGLLLIRKGQEMTGDLLDRIRKLQSQAGLHASVRVIVPCLSLHAR